MSKALIGHSGFVGSTLKKQTTFEHLYRSTNIHEIRDQSFNLLVCAGAPAEKWKANQNPKEDNRAIDKLIEHIDTVQCDTFVLISTVDVFNTPSQVDENTIIDKVNLQPYGYNRYRLEEFVQAKFQRSLIIRLPGLVGPGLKKNIIFDLLHNNQVEKIDSESLFQFYPMVNLWFDIQIALANELELVHLTSEPISVAQVASRGFGFKFENRTSEHPPSYNIKTCHASFYSEHEHYTYNATESIQAIRAYAQTEPLSKLNNKQIDK
jgi:dTDP-4-dehydrorhamnose reductase